MSHTIEDSIAAYEQLPASYNQAMIRGTLRYCKRILGKANGHAGDLLGKVAKYVEEIVQLRKQIDVATFAQLDLAYIEKEFQPIEDEAVALGYLPRIDDLSL
jgi:hypothetical protein